MIRNMETVMKNEKVISIKEFFLFILLKWRMILLAAIIMGGIANIYAYEKSYENKKNIEAQIQMENEEKDFSNYTAGMSQTEIEDTENIASNYLSYKKTYERMSDYCKNSIRMQIDPNAVAVSSKVFYIENCKDPAGLIAMYNASLVNKDICEEIVEKTDWTTKSAYISELVTVEDSFKKMGDSKNNIVVEEKENTKSAVMLVKVMTPESKSSQIISDILEQRVLELGEESKNSFGQFKIKLIQEKVTVESDSVLLQEQQTYKERLNNINNMMRGVFDTLKPNQQSYYNALIQNEQQEQKLKQNIQVPSVQIINGKYIVIGVVVGVFLVGIYLLLVYVMDEHLHASQDVEEVYEMPVINKIFTEKQKKRLFSKIDYKIVEVFQGKLNGREATSQKIKMICTEINAVIEKGNMKKIHISSSSSSTLVRAYCDKIITELKSNTCQVTTGGSVITDPTSLEKLAQADGAVFVEQIMDSRVSDIEKEKNYCKKLNIHIIGTVVLE